MTKSNLTLYGVLAFWVVILIAIFAFHIAIPTRFLYLIAFMCVGWLAWWTVNAIEGVVRGTKPSTKKEVSDTKTKNKNTKKCHV